MKGDDKRIREFDYAEERTQTDVYLLTVL